jgi:hypothetical protein
MLAQPQHCGHVKPKRILCNEYPRLLFRAGDVIVARLSYTANIYKYTETRERDARQEHTNAGDFAKGKKISSNFSLRNNPTFLAMWV